MLNKQSADLNVKKILMKMHRTFEESPSRRADYRKVALATEKVYLLHFCAIYLAENVNGQFKDHN